MSLFAKSCVCGARALPGKTRCALHQSGSGRASSCLACGARTNGARYCVRHMLTPEQERILSQPWRLGYKDPEYLKNKALRFRLAGGRCEDCGAELRPHAWQCDHEVPLVDGGSSEVKNLRVRCTDPCHKLKTRADRRRRRHA